MEYQKRSSDEKIIYATALLEICPISEIICGMIFTLSLCVGHFPILCHISEQIGIIALAGQSVSIGFYQLSRLYYCFAQEMVHGTHGYPEFLYVIMYMIGIMIVISSSVFPWFVHDFDIKCGINDKYQYYPLPDFQQTDQITSNWRNATGIILIIWDITTLWLYTYKVIQFRLKSKIQLQIKKRFMSILNRILILTLCYESGWICVMVLSIIQDQLAIIEVFYCVQCMTAVASFMMSYTIFLMQQHNTDRYRKFLNGLYESKLYYIGCCCFGRMIRNDLYSSNSMNSPNIEMEAEASTKAGIRIPRAPTTQSTIHEDMPYLETNIQSTLSTLSVN